MYAKMKTDIAIGEIFENWVASYFKRRGWAIKRAKGNVPSYDLILTKDQTSIYVECKYQPMSDRTGNYALEQRSLEHTQSSVLITGTLQEAYAIPMNTARELFNQYPKKQTGDFAFNFSALVPKDVFRINHYQRL